MVLTLKPAGSACNMRCDYCYYIGKHTAARMSAETLELAVRQYAAFAGEEEELHFLWHGGEPLLMPLDFYRLAIRLQEKYAHGRPVHNSLQTNGTLINSETADFFTENNWLIGVSIDGPRPGNDSLRHMAAREESAFMRVMQSIETLDRHGTEWNAMATVNSANVGKPEEFYNFFRNIGTPFLQFSPISERQTPHGSPAAPGEDGIPTRESVTPEQWGIFLCRVFDLWATQDVGRIFVQIFEATLARHLGASPGVCMFAPECGAAPALEANGDVYTCDHFVYDRYRLGNIHTHDLARLLKSDALRNFGKAKHGTLPNKCIGCRYLSLCGGECPKNRVNGINRLCEGYKMYFSHTERFMKHAARMISPQI